MDLATLGWVDGWAKMVTTGFGLLLGFYVGTMTDRLKPVRLMAPVYIVLALLVFWSFFYVHDKWSYLITFCARNLVQFVLGGSSAPSRWRFSPREKIGQFCSAQAVFYQFICNLAGPLIGMLFDHLHNNRFGFLWTATFYALAALTYWKVYLNWKARRGHLFTPHAG